MTADKHDADELRRALDPEGHAREQQEDRSRMAGILAAVRERPLVMIEGIEPDVETSVRRAGIALEIRRERARQDRLKAEGKFARTCADDMTNAERFVVLGEEVGEVAREVTENLGLDPVTLLASGNMRTELIQIAAVCMAWVEGLDREADEVEARSESVRDRLGF